ncbi:hypothetical protein CsSME_00028966 [Camellia sinensis var. sinensis]
MQKNKHHQPAGMPLPPSPCLSRSRSEHPATSPPPPQSLEIHTNRSNSGRSTSVQRSKSTTKSRTKNKVEENNLNPSMTSPRIPKKLKDQHSIDDHASVKFLQRTNNVNDQVAVAKRVRSTMPGSPSAWALSPGRSSPCSSPVLQKSPGGGGRGGGMSGVLKYFRQKKKVAMVQEEEFHRFRILHNRLLQWRFVNARAQASRAAMKAVAEKKLFYVWLRIFILRKSIMEKRIQTHNLKHGIKLYEIINPQISLLNEWARLETKNSEAVGRIIRKLSAISIRLPLVHEAKADVSSVHDAMNSAMGVMQSIEAMATQFLPQVEKICFLITELIIMEKQQNEHMEQLHKWMSLVLSLEAKERSLRVHLLQEAHESKESQMSQLMMDLVESK